MKLRKKLFSVGIEILPALRYVLGYWAWVWAFRLMALSLITYALIGNASPFPKFQDISDAFRSNEVSLMGLSSALFLLLLLSFKPHVELLQPGLSDLRREVEHQFMPGFVAGAILAGILAILLNLFGGYQYLGSFIRLGEAPIEIANIALRMFALILLATSEEWIFRRSLTQIFSHIRLKLFPNLSPPFAVSPQIIAVLYCATKSLQFELGWMHLVSLYLISLSLSLRATLHRSFSNGAGFWAAMLVVFHPLLSLPIFGNEFSGVLLLKFEPQTVAIGSPPLLSRLAFGGAGGPLASLAFQLLVLVDCSFSIWRVRKRR